MDHVAGLAEAMPRDGGGGGGFQNGGGANMVSVAQLRRLLGLQGGGRGAGAAGAGGGDDDGAGGRQARGRRDRRQARADSTGAARGMRRGGDWACGECAFAPNFAWKSRCFRCGAPRRRELRATADRAAPARTSNSTSIGPVGAGGSRPMLPVFSSRAAAAAAGAPAFRPAGSSVAARAMARPAAHPPASGDADRRAGAQQQPQQQRAQRQGQQGIGGAQAAAVMAAAAGGGGHAACGTGRGQQAGPTGAATMLPGSTFGDHRRPRWADDDPPCDRGCDDDDDAYMEEDAAEADRDQDDEDEADEDGCEEAEATPEELRQAWLAECRAVKSIEAQGRHAGSAALAAAKEARDAAEDAWRRAIGPTPVSIRMGRAQQRLDKAAKALERCRLDLEEFEEEADRQRAAIRQRIEEAEERYKMRSEQLDGLHAEAGELATGSAAANVARRAESVVCDMVAAELQALAESLPEGSDARGSVNLILAKMASTASPSGPQRFDIGDTDGGGGGGDEGDGQRVGGEGDGGAHWTEDASGRWNRRTAAAARGRGPSATEDGWQLPRRPFRATANRVTAQGSNSTAAASAGCEAAPTGIGFTALDDRAGSGEGGKPAEGGPKPPGVRGGPGPAAAPAAATDAGTDGQGGGRNGQGRKRDGGDDDNARCKSHRGEDEVQEVSVELGGDDAARAEQLQKEQAIAIWAARNAQSIFGDNASRAIAGQLYAHKVKLVEQRAREVGVVAKAKDGRDLVELAPEEFTEWIQAVLEPAEKEASEAKDL